MSDKYKVIEYMCSWCGMRSIRGVNAGRPVPGICPRKPKGRDGKSRPHTWVINKKL